MGYLLTLILIFSGATLFLLLVGIIFVLFTAPKLPENTDMVIGEVMSADLPELVMGHSGYVVSDNYKIWYESIAPKEAEKGSILLFMGMTSDALAWPPLFINEFVDAGYQVIRFDYRGTGMSDWVENWKKKPYTLTDLVKDAEAVLDVLNIKDVHLVGLSMGGMVAQEFAYKNAQRTQTLTSIMSSGDTADEALPKVAKGLAVDFIKVGIKYGIFKSDRSTVKLIISAKVILRGNAQYDIDVKETAQQVLYKLKRRNGYNPKVQGQHEQAVSLSGPRYEKIKDLAIPALVIHGINDPLVPIEHSKKLAAVLPNAKTKWFENMGHDLPPNLIDAISKEIISNLSNHKQGVRS